MWFVFMSDWFLVVFFHNARFVKDLIHFGIIDSFLDVVFDGSLFNVEVQRSEV